MTIILGKYDTRINNHCNHHRFYLSTAISYTNGYPHIGHAYEFLTADVIGM
jgi:methionyl-tRNA synthetase